MRNRFYLSPLSLLTLFLLYNYQAVPGPALAQVKLGSFVTGNKWFAFDYVDVVSE